MHPHDAPLPPSVSRPRLLTRGSAPPARVAAPAVTLRLRSESSCAHAAVPDAAGALCQQAASVAQELDAPPAALQQQQPTALLAQLSSTHESFRSAHSDAFSDASSMESDEEGPPDNPQQGAPPLSSCLCLPGVPSLRGAPWPCPCLQPDHEPWLPRAMAASHHARKSQFVQVTMRASHNASGLRLSGINLRWHPPAGF
jgi:hypothetical protein